MTTTIEEFVAKVGWEIDDKDVKTFEGNVSSLGKTIAAVAAVITGATAAVIALTNVTNRQTAVNTNLARSFGINETALENWSFLLSAIGLDANAVVRLMKDVNVRLGQAAAGIGDVNTIKDAVNALNIEFAELQKLSPDEQYRMILNAAKDIEDPTVAIAAAQQLLGRSGGVIAGFLRQQEGTLESILETQGLMNLQTDAARQSAVEYIALWDDTLAVIDSAKALFAGLVGEAIKPMLKEFTSWVAENKELIRTKVKSWVKSFVVVLRVLVKILKFIFDKFNKAITAIGGFEKAIKLASIMFATFISLKTLATLGTFINMIKQAGIAQALFAAKVKLSAVAMQGVKAAGLGLFALIAEDIYQFLTGGKSAVGEVSKAFEGLLEDALAWSAEFLGISPEQLNQAHLMAIASFTEGFDYFITRVEIGFSRFIDLILSLTPAIKIAISNSVDFIMSKWSSLFVFIQSGLESITTWFEGLQVRIITAFKGLKEKVKALMPALPDWFPGGGSPTPSPTGGNITPSPGAITNQGNQSSKVTVQNNMSVTQLPGEDSAGFATKVAKILFEKVAAAVNNNESGVVY